VVSGTPAAPPRVAAAAGTAGFAAAPRSVLLR
jgi:hypothetical protein